MSDEDTDGTEKSPENQSTGKTGGSDTEREPGEVTDDMLPEDLRPSEDNPLARHPDQTGDEDDVIGQDREDGAQTAPLDAEQAEYGS